MSVDLLTLLTTHGRQLHALLWRITLSEHVAEDLLQDLFLKLHSCPSFQQADQPIAFARRVAINMACDWRRRERRQAGELIADAATPQRPEPWEVLQQKEAVQITLNALAALSPQYREIVALRFLEQQSFAEIAKALGSTPHRIRARSERALKQLRDLLAEQRQELTSGGD